VAGKDSVTMVLPTEFSETATNGQLLSPAMKITEQADADVYFERLVRHGMRLDPELSRETAEENLRSNLGYWAGYCDHETRLRVERLFRCEHPIFGDAKKGPPTPQEAFDHGVRVATERMAAKDSG